MKILIAVPTFRRPNFLPRILACFDRLDYQNKKMVIINDDPDTKYFYNENPNVEIINIDKHIPLAIKRNIFASWDFDVMFPLDDDDLFLPNRLKNHITQYEIDNDLDLYRNDACIFTAGHTLKKQTGSSFTNSSFTRKGYFKSGGYTNYDHSNTDDHSISHNFQYNCKTKIISNLEEVDFLYQFDGQRYHNTHNHEVLMNENMINDTLKERLQSGDITLIPDYDGYDNIVNLCNLAIEKGEIPIKNIRETANFELID